MKVTVTRVWPDGERITFTVHAEGSQVEALALARINAVEALREASSDMRSEWAEDTVREDGAPDA